MVPQCTAVHKERVCLEEGRREERGGGREWERKGVREGERENNKTSHATM